MTVRVTLPALQQMKHDGRKIVAVVAYDYQMAQIVDRAGVDLVSVGDSVGVNVWGRASELDVTLDEMILVCRAVRRGVTRALVSCDMPYGPLQESPEAAARAAVRLVTEGGADLVKLDGAAEHPDGVTAVTREGIPVWAQFGVTPQTAARAGRPALPPSELVAAMKDQLVREAQFLEEAGASLLDFTHSGSVAGPPVVRAVRIPVLGGLGGGPWLDGRVRAVFPAIGYLASAIDDQAERYANVAETTLAAIRAFGDDVRAGRQIRGGAPAARTA